VQVLATLFSLIQTLLVNTPFINNFQVLVLFLPSQFKESFVLKHGGKYAHFARALTPFAPTPTSLKTIGAF